MAETIGKFAGSVEGRDIGNALGVNILLIWIIACCAAILVFVLSMKKSSKGGCRLTLTGTGVSAILSGINTALLVVGDLDHAAMQLGIATEKIRLMMVMTAVGLTPIATAAALVCRLTRSPNVPISLTTDLRAAFIFCSY